MKRNPFNTNHHIYTEHIYQGCDIQMQHGPMIKEHLEKTYNNIRKAINQYGRACMIRFDLHVPENCELLAASSNLLMSKFFASLKAKIKHSQGMSRKTGNRVHDTEVRYQWCREISQTGKVHYHIVLLLNHNSYNSIGKFDLDSNNMYSRIHEAWGSALGVHPEDLQGLIHIPTNPTYCIWSSDERSFQDAFYRASYLCKFETKVYEQGIHSFGGSRI
ncbi:inovirus Gp2 family protein [Delftia acidovorans]|uniref:inovirus Gp2 family protein n=1 Tax=Delftia acidovorans TaxID=80866 RepID=UPI0022AB9166|nr:inovirus Gp2 family protein [Delftia acidovorans]WAT84363.1 inovirus Gp2 family protein [Delftia acidovorans]